MIQLTGEFQDRKGTKMFPVKYIILEVKQRTENGKKDAGKKMLVRAR